MSHFITPGDKLYHRAHNNMPGRADLDTYHIKVFNQTNMVPRSTVTVGSEEQLEDSEQDNLPLRSFTVQYLKDNYEPHSVMTSLSCAGNRRGEFK